MRRSPLRAARRRRAILLAVQTGRSSIYTIAARTGVSPCAVKYHLRHLIADGAVKHLAYGQIRPARPFTQVQLNNRPAILEWMDDEEVPPCS